MAPPGGNCKPGNNGTNPGEIPGRELRTSRISMVHNESDVAADSRFLTVVFSAAVILEIAADTINDIAGITFFEPKRFAIEGIGGNGRQVRGDKIGEIFRQRV